jgi:ornithine cyclodeaminase/alanine dehydrogenase-like protein (mu-crystallin family)
MESTSPRFRAKFGMISPSYNEYDRLSKEQIRSADIIICGTPSDEPLFHHSILTSANGRVKPRLIIAVGSFKPNMIELPPEILIQAVKHHGDHIHMRKRAIEGGCVIADIARAMEQTGEFIAAKLDPHHVVELGEIVMLEEQFAHEQDDDESAIDDSETPNSPGSFSLSDGKSSLASALSESTNDGGFSSRRSSRSSSFTNISRRGSLIFRKRNHTLGDHGPEKKQSKDEREMNNWLVNGNVIYKSVGLGLMDLVVGVEIVALAKTKDVGVTVSDF